jgi:diguanylate cyclase
VHRHRRLRHRLLLAVLGRLPAALLKIDKSFIDDIDTIDSAAAIVGAIVTMAHALGMTVIAEGVERSAQAQRLRDLGCDSAQGYLFARPMPNEDATALIASRLVPGPRETERVASAS